MGDGHGSDSGQSGELLNRPNKRGDEQSSNRSERASQSIASGFFEQTFGGTQIDFTPVT